MNKPALYQKSRNLLRQDDRRIIGEYLNMMKLRPDGRDSLIDVGCGPGDVLVDLLLPILPKTYNRAVGVDISPEMVEYARSLYSHDHRVQYNVLDMEVERLPPEYYEKFDHATSFLLLHWVRNQRQALQNIYDLLVPGGDCMITCFGSCSVFASYDSLVQNPRWKKYMFDLKEVVPISQKHDDIWTLYRNMFKEVGFVDESIEVRERILVFPGLAEITDLFNAVNVFTDRVPLEEKTEYIAEMCKFFEEKGFVENGKYTIPHKLVVAYARKPNCTV